MTFASGVVAVTLGVAAAFQLALALGAPWGDHAYGGRVDTDGGQLPGRYRVFSGIAVVVLAFAIWIVIEAADMMPSDPSWIGTAAWIVFVGLVLNTLGNLASTSKIERFGLGALTAVAALATLAVAMAA